MRLTGKTALITGGVGEIGAATVRLMAREGAKVVIIDLEGGEALASEVGGRFLAHDVTDEEGWRAIVADIVAEHGGIDILVNAAGIEGDLQDSSPLCSYAEWKRVLSINVDGTFLSTRAALPIMIQKGSGSIINLSSMAMYVAAPIAVPYGVSKAAVWHLSRSVASFAASSGTRVRCNSVHPGLIRSRMHDNILAAVGKMVGRDVESMEKDQLRMIPFGERADPKEVANVILFLASDEASYITGAEFKVDGGWSLWMTK